MAYDVLTATPPNGVSNRDRIVFPYPSGRSADSYETTGAYLSINNGELAYQQSDEVFSLAYRVDGAHIYWNAGPVVAPGKAWALRVPLTRQAEVSAGSPATPIVVVASSRALTMDDNGTILRADAGVTLTVPATLPTGFSCSAAQWGAGTVTIAAGSGAANRSSTTASSAQYSLLSVLVVKNSDGNSAEYIVGESG